MQQLKIKKSHSLNQFEIARVDHPIASWDSRITVILIDADLGERWSGSTTTGTTVARVAVSLLGMDIACARAHKYHRCFSSSRVLSGSALTSRCSSCCFGRWYHENLHVNDRSNRRSCQRQRASTFLVTLRCYHRVGIRRFRWEKSEICRASRPPCWCARGSCQSLLPVIFVRVPFRNVSIQLK